VGDDETALRAALGRGLGADVLVTTGGVSVGEHDLVRASLVRLGVEEVFWGVAVRPGRPIAFGVAGRTLVFGLPGNPVSALVGFELFVRPALLALQGAADPGPELLPGRLGVAVRQNAARDELLRSRMRIEADAVVLEPLAGQESHMIVRAAGANALALVRRGDGELPAGAPVRYLRL
jgi:molybdopterin molybdotransferase